ncbi:MAG: RNA polymerase sigma factor [Pirellulaceae bacterium]|nr:MAG: RNA polymerase sigma factor [Pirellulaceae bacterium]
MSLVDYAEQGAKAAEKDPDVQLMLRVQQDDAVAFEQLIETYQKRLHRVLRHTVASESVAEDLVQEVFLRVWRARKKYRPTAKFSTWLFHIAHNVANNSVRDFKRRREFQVAAADASRSDAFSMDQMVVASTGAMPVRRLDKTERAEMVKAAIEALNERQRMALMLFRFEGLSYQEIAEAMGLSVQAVKSLLRRARVNLKTLLEPYLDAGLVPGSAPAVDKDADEVQ